MSRFDAKTFFELTGRGTSPIGALGTAFGMPSCMINLGAEALALLPSPILRAIRSSTANGAARADDVVKSIVSKLRFGWGVVEYDTEDGTFRFVSDSSENGLDKDEGTLLNSVGAVLGALGAAAGFGGRLYNNYQSTQAQIDSIKDCFNSYSDYLKYSGGSAGDERMRLAGISPERYQNLVDQGFGIDREELFDALDFRLRALEAQRRIDAEIAARLSGSKPEPEFLSDYAPYVSGTELLIESQVSSAPPQKEIFRLTFGPPVSKEGRFILSVDGLYYDSQTSGIIPALMELESRKGELDSNLLWNLEQDPNLGGRGKPVNLDQFKSYVNTILDSNILDDSNSLQEYYLQDNLLQDLIGQKNRRIFDVSGQLGELESTGASQILITNIRQVLLSETSHFLNKINKRKKQIELAVKLPVIYGKGSLYNPGGVPINDFSYLEGINFQFDIGKQKSLVLNQTDVSSVVLPINVKFTQQVEASDQIVLEHLLVNNIALGAVISNPSGVISNSLSINQDVEQDGLIALYNYLNLYDYETSSSFQTRNGSKLGERLNATVYGPDQATIYNRGVGIVYLNGITKHSKTSPTVPSSLGSFVKLPPEPEFQDLIYNPRGATFETWVHVPELDGEYYGFNDDYDVSGLYRIILANENTGLQSGVSAQSNILDVRRDNGTNVVRGMLFGFTRDRQITQGLNPSNNSLDNSIQHACLFLAPTQSFDSSSVAFIKKTNIEDGNCYSASGWNCMKFSIWEYTNGVSLSSCGREFVQLTVTFNPNSNAIKLYCDGKLLTTSSYTDVFGIDPANGMPNIPSFKKNNSFEYNANTMSSVGVYDLSSGPSLDTYFTPWILGGGYTDGNQNGNFMGGRYSGVISGLKGYLGGTKFYSKPLSDTQILNNFNASRLFFKNIEVPNLMWEPILSE